MKGNNGSGNNVSRDDWETPQWLFDILNKQYNFKLDCCATKENRKCPFFTDNFLKEPQNNVMAWINPPFSKAKERIEHFLKTRGQGIGIYRCDNIETQIWSLIFKEADWIFVFNKRICYEGHEGKGARFGSALFGIGCLPPKELEGTILYSQKQCSQDN